MILHPSKHLTSNYEKNSESSNYKLLDLSHLEHLEILKNLDKIEAFRDMDNADGFTLDKTGKNVLELRNSRDDETFRRAIKIKIISNLSAGTIEDINTIAEILFEDDFISLCETWDKEEYAFEPAALFLAQKSNPEYQMMFFEYMKHLVTSVKAGGVRLYNRIYTDIPKSEIYTGSAVSSDFTKISVRTKSLENTVIPEAVSFMNVINVSDVSGIYIPTKTIKTGMKLSSTIYSACAVFGDNGYMNIPTAELRGG